MDFIWSPWRYDYLASYGDRRPTCVFCIGDDASHDAERLVVLRATHNFVILNLFPYTSGHLMIAPYEHRNTIAGAAPEQLAEMIQLAERAVGALKKIYNPNGFNLGMNLGEAAGAGIREHFHFHVVPRWIGDANFVSIVGETRVLPEELNKTYARVKASL